MTSEPHRIRLRGFWDITPLGDGRTRHCRAFGRPRTLDPNERAWLVCDAVPGPATVAVNGTVIGSAGAGPVALDVTDHLRPRNEVTIDVAADPSVPLGDVAMEIRSA